MPTSLPFHVIAKPTGAACNLACSYCYYLEKEKLYPDARRTMSPAILETYIRQYIAAQPQDIVHFAWQGGEPVLAGLEFFREVVRIQKRFGCGKRIENVLQTNGTLLDDQWAQFLAEHGFLVGVSVDGPPALHDARRRDKGHRATLGAVIQAIETLKRYSVPFNTLTVVNSLNSSHPLDVYHFLKSIGSEYMQFIPAVDLEARLPRPDGLTLVPPGSPNDAAVTDWSVDPKTFGTFLCTIFDEWVRRDVGRHYVQIFEVALEIWYGSGASLCVFQESCGRALAIERNGDLYSCDHFVYPENKLGNIVERPLQDLVSSPQQRIFCTAKRDTLPRACRECDVRYACHGACPKHRFLRTSDGEPGLNYLCEAYKKFFRHVAPYMQFMVRELEASRSPVNVMNSADQIAMVVAPKTRN